MSSQSEPKGQGKVDPVLVSWQRTTKRVAGVKQEIASCRRILSESGGMPGIADAQSLAACLGEIVYQLEFSANRVWKMLPKHEVRFLKAGVQDYECHFEGDDNQTRGETVAALLETAERAWGLCVDAERQEHAAMWRKAPAEPVPKGWAE